LAPTDDTDDLCDALERLTADPGRYTRHKKLYRLEVVSSDGERCAVTPAVTRHRSRPAKANLTEIAETVRVDPADLPTVLTEWSHARLVTHLRRFTAEQLLPFAIRRQRGIQ
jgi:hypothetical protein